MEKKQCSRCDIEKDSKNNKIIPFEILLQQLRVNYYENMQQSQIAGNS